MYVYFLVLALIVCFTYLDSLISLTIFLDPKSIIWEHEEVEYKGLYY